MLIPQILETADPALLSAFDDIIDVRSPSEFAEDHAPGSINLPVLDDRERALVGTMYVQDSAFKARRLGAALVARNVARHLETTLADRPSGYRPLVYCWRGGQRSNAMAVILSQIGWRTFVLSGGYRTYRRRVQERLYGPPLDLKLVLLDGGTGTGKTEMLAALLAIGVQTLDLEALAEHSGSLFGAWPGEAQPRQKMFESRLLKAVDALDPRRPVVVEAESNKIGDRILPPALWEAMSRSPRVLLTAPIGERADYLVRRYATIASSEERLKAAIDRLPVHIGRKQVEAFRNMAQAGDLNALAHGLIRAHYDPAYERASRKVGRTNFGEVNLQRLDAGSIRQGAQLVASKIREL